MNAHKAIEKPTKSKEPKLLNASFNQDQGCFAVCHERGFRVYNTDPMELRMKRNFLHDSKSGIGLVVMLHRTNYVGLVGGGKNPKFPINKAVIWDDLKKKPSIILEFNSPVLNLILSRIRIIVILKNQVIIHAFESRPKLRSSYETYDNELGICDLSNNDGNSILAFPGRSMGQIELIDISPSRQDRNLISIIKAHKAKIRTICLNNAGTMVASASETGTLIRIHSTINCSLLYEFRRGVDKAFITSMKFSPNDSKLAVLSDKNTLHIFNVQEVDNSNRSHFLSKFSMLPIPIPNYFNSTWSFVSKHLDETSEEKDVATIGWSDNDSIIILWKFRAIWEKYVIDEVEPGKWEIIREGWRSLGELHE